MECALEAMECSGQVERLPDQLEAAPPQDPDLLEILPPWRLPSPDVFEGRSPPGLCPPRHEPVVAAVLHPWPVFQGQSS